MRIFREIHASIFRIFATVNSHCRFYDRDEWIEGIIVEYDTWGAGVATDPNNVEWMLWDEIYPIV